MHLNIYKQRIKGYAQCRLHYVTMEFVDIFFHEFFGPL